MIKELGEPFSCGSNSIWRAPAEHWVHARLLAQILMLWYCSYLALRCSRLKILTLVRSLAIATRVVTRNPINAPERGESGRTIDITQTVHNDSPIDITPSHRPPSPLAWNLDTQYTTTSTANIPRPLRQQRQRRGGGRRGNKSDINLMGHCPLHQCRRRPPPRHVLTTTMNGAREREGEAGRERGADEKHTLNGHTNGHKKEEAAAEAEAMVIGS